MINFDELLDKEPYSLDKKEKEELFFKSINKLTRHHYNNCQDYKKILEILGYSPESDNVIDKIPFLPVRLFKKYELLSVKKSEIIKTMTSSGTSGQSPSKIFLDKDNSLNQTKVLSKIISNVIGAKRVPMLIIDSENVIKDRKMFSARGAGIIGFSMFGKEIIFALDENMEMDFQKVEDFCERHKGETILVFGFTSLIWDYLYKGLVRANKKIDLSNGILIHGGGWKKLADEEVDNKTFKESLNGVTGLNKIFNYYGMIEQTGSIFMECENGNLHCSIFSDIIVRDRDFSICGKNEMGLIELVSLLPTSYPGHVILSEDVGEILGEDDCSCGRLGKYFRVHGRIEKAEIRGCSDAHG